MTLQKKAPPPRFRRRCIRRMYGQQITHQITLIFLTNCIKYIIINYYFGRKRSIYFWVFQNFYRALEIFTVKKLSRKSGPLNFILNLPFVFPCHIPSRNCTLKCLIFRWKPGRWRIQWNNPTKERKIREKTISDLGTGDPGWDQGNIQHL